ncbi:thermonuclease family protein [Fulvivirgaceae bacterium PWU4]|uniref:Thermonuclease family protein n=1 Tax=Chryseosolibacter histidini TaxID=2782349 RepID=A0AAP2DRI9_9BACT|nr:thermonuclease family protein [Chryseosolibacter histidini]MBT1701178.1 thermonuclease family protein [Chryseosolibacter histidini]
MRKIAVGFLACIAMSGALANDSMPGKVVSVVDGNTIEMHGSDQEKYIIVLAGIDSPELTQKYGEEAKRYLEKLLLQKEVTVHFQGKDRKGNYLAVVLKGKIDARVELLKEGLAWTAEKDPLPELEAHRTAAQEKGRGLWKEENPTPPWIHRRQQSTMQPKSS